MTVPEIFKSIVDLSDKFVSEDISLVTADLEVSKLIKEAKPFGLKLDKKAILAGFITAKEEVEEANYQDDPSYEESESY